MIPPSFSLTSTVSFQSETTEPFVSFPLEVKNHRDVDQSLQTFLLPDVFTGDEQYNAEGIGKIDAKRYHRVIVAPKILIIQLKRFEYDLSTGERVKINSKYMFPMSFDFSQVMKDTKTPVIYDLIGVTMHMGVAQGGHYYTYAGKKDSEWHCFNDTSVTHFNKNKLPNIAAGGCDSDIQNSTYERNDNAYLLFYRKRSPNKEQKGIDDEIQEEEKRKDPEEKEVIIQKLLLFQLLFQSIRHFHIIIKNL